MPLTLTDAERAMLNALAAPINKSRQPEFFSAVTANSRLKTPPRSGQALCTGRRARCCVIFGALRQTFVRAGWGLEGLADEFPARARTESEPMSCSCRTDKSAQIVTH